MTFACKIQTLLEDKKIWWFCTYFKGPPNDFLAFQLLTKQSFLFKKHYIKHLFFQLLFAFNLKRRRLLISPLPSISTHIEVDWIPFNLKNIIESEHQKL